MQVFASNPLCPWFPDAISATNPRVIDDSRARKLSNDLKRCTYYETCATYGLNVERVFQDGNCSGRGVCGPGRQQCCPARRRTVPVPSSQLGRSVAARQNKSGTRSLAVQLLYSHRPGPRSTACSVCVGLLCVWHKGPYSRAGGPFLLHVLQGCPPGTCFLHEQSCRGCCIPGVGCAAQQAVRARGLVWLQKGGWWHSVEERGRRSGTPECCG